MEKQIAPDVPQMPPEAIEFAEQVGKLAEKYQMRSVEMNIQIDTGPYSAYKDRSRKERITENMTVHVSRKDSRGRPRTQISIEAEITLRSDVVWEPDTSN